MDTCPLGHAGLVQKGKGKERKEVKEKDAEESVGPTAHGLWKCSFPTLTRWAKAGATSSVETRGTGKGGRCEDSIRNDEYRVRSANVKVLHEKAQGKGRSARGNERRTLRKRRLGPLRSSHLWREQLLSREFGIETGEGGAPTGAADAATCPRNGVQAGEGDVLATDAANAIFASLHASERKLDFAKGAELAFDIGDGHAGGGIANCDASVVLRILVHENLLAALFDALVQFITLGDKNFT